MASCEDDNVVGLAKQHVETPEMRQLKVLLNVRAMMS
jgi:hypothetical protein